MRNHTEIYHGSKSNSRVHLAIQTLKINKFWVMWFSQNFKKINTHTHAKRLSHRIKSNILIYTYSNTNEDVKNFRWNGVNTCLNVITLI